MSQFSFLCSGFASLYMNVRKIKVDKMKILSAGDAEGNSGKWCRGLWGTYSTSHACVTESRGYSMQGENSLLYVLFSKTILCFLDPQLAGRKTSQEETVLFVLAVVLIIANAGTIVLLIKFLHDGLKRYVGKLLLHLHVWLLSAFDFAWLWCCVLYITDRQHDETLLLCPWSNESNQQRLSYLLQLC